jgi:ribosomal protein S24E
MTHKLHVISEKENPVYIRKEITGFIEGEKTPSFKEVEELIADKYKTSEGDIKINFIKGKFGSNKSAINVFVYKSAAQKKKFDVTTRKQRDADNKVKIEGRKSAAAEKKKAAAPKTDGGEQ